MGCAVSGREEPRYALEGFGSDQGTPVARTQKGPTSFDSDGSLARFVPVGVEDRL